MESVADLPFVSGHLALDYVNTAEERGDPQARDFLRSPVDLLRWGQRRGVLSPAAELGRGAGTELRRALAAREILYRLLADRATDRPFSAGGLNEFSDLAAAAERSGSLETGRDGGLAWHWPPTELSSVRHQAVSSAVDLLRAPPDGRLRQCPGEHCGWFFLDRTKRGNRRWCSMSECGQEAKSLRRRARLLTS